MTRVQVQVQQFQVQVVNCRVCSSSKKINTI